MGAPHSSAQRLSFGHTVRIRFRRIHPTGALAVGKEVDGAGQPPQTILGVAGKRDSSKGATDGCLTADRSVEEGVEILDGEGQVGKIPLTAADWE